MQKYVADYHIIKYEKMSEKGMFPHQAPVVQILDSAIHWITQLVLLVFIRWIVIYPVDSAIHRLNNWGLKCSKGQISCPATLKVPFSPN